MTSTTTRLRTAVLAFVLVVLLVGQTSRADALVQGGVVMAPSVAAQLGLAGGTAGAVAGGIAAAPLIGGAALLGGAIWAIGWASTGEAAWFWPDGDPDADPAGSEPGGGFVYDYCKWSGNKADCFTAYDGSQYLAVYNYTYPAPADPDNYNYGLFATDAAGEVCASSGVNAAGQLTATSASWPIQTAQNCYDGVTLISMWQSPKAGGAWEPVPGTEGSPVARKVVTTGTCSDGSTPTAESQPYTSTDEFLPVVPLIVCPAGTWLESAIVERHAETLPSRKIGDFTAPAEFADPAWKYAECVGGGCKLMLHKVLTDGQRVPCDSTDVVCTSWREAPQGAYECLWGTHVMPLTDCLMFENIDTETYAGPETKTEQNTTPVTAPGTAANPLVLDDGCGTGSWFNPFTKLARGVACALEWAFVPRTETLTNTYTTLRTDLGARPPFSVFPVVEPVVVSMRDAADGFAGGCTFPDLTPPGAIADGLDPNTVVFPCTAPGWWTTILGYIRVFLWMGTGWAIFSMTHSAFGANSTDVGGE